MVSELCCKYTNSKVLWDSVVELLATYHCCGLVGRALESDSGDLVSALLQACWVTAGTCLRCASVSPSVGKGTMILLFIVTFFEID